MTTEIKTTVEQDLHEIRKSKIDTIILQRKNEELCKVNNDEIARLAKVIGYRETSAKEKILDRYKATKERKIDTPAGYVALNKMPDKWIYEDSKIITWAKEDVLKTNTYVKIETIESINKKQIKSDVAEGYIKVEDVPGLTIIPQDPKFVYKLKEDLL